MVENLGLQPDPNGEDLYLRFDPSLLEPLHIELPLHSVNREARDVAIKYAHQQGLIASRSSTQSELEFLRAFDPRADTVFLPTPADVEGFIKELIDRIVEPDMLERYVGTSTPALSRLAITPSSCAFLVKEGVLETFFDFGGTIDTIYVIDAAYPGESVISHLEDAGSRSLLRLESEPCARLRWSSSRREWDEAGSHHSLAKLREVFAGLDYPTFTTSEHDLEIKLVRLSASTAEQNGKKDDKR